MFVTVTPVILHKQNSLLVAATKILATKILLCFVCNKIKFNFKATQRKKNQPEKLDKNTTKSIVLSHVSIFDKKILLLSNSLVSTNIVRTKIKAVFDCVRLKGCILFSKMDKNVRTTRIVFQRTCI